MATSKIDTSRTTPVSSMTVAAGNGDVDYAAVAFCYDDAKIKKADAILLFDRMRLAFIRYMSGRNVS